MGPVHCSGAQPRQQSNLKHCCLMDCLGSGFKSLDHNLQDCPSLWALVRAALLAHTGQDPAWLH